MFAVFTALAGNSSARQYVGRYATLRGARRAASARTGYGIVAIIVGPTGEAV